MMAKPLTFGACESAFYHSNTMIMKNYFTVQNWYKHTLVQVMGTFEIKKIFADFATGWAPLFQHPIQNNLHLKLKKHFDFLIKFQLNWIVNFYFRGVILYELLCGVRPFERHQDDCIFFQRQQSVPNLPSNLSSGKLFDNRFQKEPSHNRTSKIENSNCFSASLKECVCLSLTRTLKNSNNYLHVLGAQVETVLNRISSL